MSRTSEDNAPGTAPSRRRRSRESEPPSRDLTPYQARLGVEMDDTAVSKVRDPSASIRLGPEGQVLMMPQESPPPAAPPSSSPPQRAFNGPVVSVLFGGAFGVLIVLLAVALVRWWGGGP